MIELEDSDLKEKKELWIGTVRKMREGLKTHIDEHTFEGIREDKLYHGLKLISSTTMLGQYTEICYCKETQEYLVLDSPVTMHRYSMQGKPLQPAFTLSSTMTFTKMIWCHEAKALVCYIPHDDLMWIISSTCILYQVVRNEFRIENLFYEPATNEVIVIGTNKITRYPLHNKEQTLNSWKTMCYIDSEWGPMWQIEYSSLIPQSSSLLRLAGSYLTTIYVMPLESGKGKEDGVPAGFLARRPSATEAAITALYFHTISKWIITGDQQGNVMGWDLKLNCVMSCLGGHNGRIWEIARHPSICGFITCSNDNVLQVWSCNLRGKLERFSEMGEIRCIALNESAAAITTLGHKLSCFTMHQLYIFYAPLTARATNLLSTTNPMYPTRVSVSSADNSVRILSSKGKQINVQILSPALKVVSIAYSGNTNRMYTVILNTGEIFVSNTQTYPMKHKHVWVNSGSPITCIVAYECYEEIRNYNLKSQKPRMIHAICTYIIVGTEDGTLKVIGETSGKQESRYLAHDGPVTKLWSSTISHHIVSIGIDKCAKVWKIFSDIKLPLALTYTVYHTIPITHIASMGYILCTISSSIGLRTHQLLMYDILKRIRLEHHLAKDHTKLVLDIATSQSLQICATSSEDNTIRIWDQQNILLKILEINTCAQKITFSSLRGDIVFSAGKHLYQIPYENHLSPKYRARIIVQEIPEDVEEKPIAEGLDYKIYEDEIDQELLLHPVSSVPLGSLDTTSSDAPRLELIIQEQMCAQFRHRDEDIISIKEGVTKATKLIASKALMSYDTWEKYFKELLNMSTIVGKNLPSHNIWTIVEKYAKINRTYNKHELFRMLYGYSIERFPDYPELPETARHTYTPLTGFLPNSLTYEIFEKEDTESQPSLLQKKDVIKYQYPSEFLMAQLKEKEASNESIAFPITLSQLAGLGEDEMDVTVARVDVYVHNPFANAVYPAQEPKHTKKKVNKKKSQLIQRRINKRRKKA